MALLLLLSTISWKVEKHYCMGHLVDVAFFLEADTCGMEINSDKDDIISQDVISCCDDEVIVIDGQDDLKLSFDDISLDQQLFLVAFTSSYFNLFEGIDENVVPFKDYSPPPLIRDIQILDQSFLI